MDTDKSEAIKSFILQNYLFTTDPAALEDDASLIQQGVMDSTGVLELIMHLETTYGIQVADHEMTPDNLDSVTSIVAYVDRKLRERRSASV